MDEASFRFSRWRYNHTSDLFHLSKKSEELAGPSDPIRLWQIRTFPFDPSCRLSTAIVLIERKDLSLELWKMTKGAPDTLQKILDCSSADTSFDKQNKELEMEGYRCIAMGAKNLSDIPFSVSLFPGGLSSSSDDLSLARSLGASLHRDDIENSVLSTSALDACGFACFDASLRSSSQRIVRELKDAGVACIMLTGDSINAALNVAIRANIISTKKIVTMELPNASDETKVLWKTTKFDAKRNREGTLKSLTGESMRKLLDSQKKGKLSLLLSGDSLEYMFSNSHVDAYRMLIRNLSSVSVIARATPELKKQVILSLKEKCGKTVMMCGTFLIVDNCYF